MLWWYLPFAVIANTYTTCPYMQAVLLPECSMIIEAITSESAEGRKLREKKKKFKSLLLFMTMHILLNANQWLPIKPMQGHTVASMTSNCCYPGLL